MGVSQAYVNSILSGRDPLGKQTAFRLQALYGLSAAWLLTGTGDMMAQPEGVSATTINIHLGGNVTGSSNVVGNSGSVVLGEGGAAAQIEKLLGQVDSLMEQNRELQRQNSQLVERNGRLMDTLLNYTKKNGDLL